MSIETTALDLAKVRAWCQARGVPVAPNGVLPADVLARYAADVVIVTCPRHWLDREVHADLSDAGCAGCRR